MNDEQFYKIAVELGMVSSKLFSAEKKLRFNLESVFCGIDLAGKTMLDIGGGTGIHSFYAAHKGANKVVCLEPELAGSNPAMEKRFKHAQRRLGTDSIERRATTFQDYEAGDTKFDIVLSHYSINHLNEEACMNLLNDQKAVQAYREIIKKLYELTRPGADLVVIDCSNRNFFGDLGIKNPVAPSIEWHKHQSPATWKRLLLEGGFTEPSIKWFAFGELRRAGELLLGHRLIAYFLNSHFRLHMRRP